MRVRVKSWIEVNGQVVIGDGRRRLMELVRKTGSLNKAARQMKMSYRAAWGKIKDTEKQLGYKLLETRTGGSSGGGSTLTDKGIKLLDAFNEFDKELNDTAERHFERLFPPLQKSPPESE